MAYFPLSASGGDGGGLTSHKTCPCSFASPCWKMGLQGCVPRVFPKRMWIRMKSILSDQVASFRYGLIAPIVCRQTPLMPGELKAYLDETASQIYEIPGSARNKVSTRTMERYLSLYRKGGYDALKPQAKSSKGRTTIPAPVLQQAIELRRERPERSVEQILYAGGERHC